ncbi:thiamine pyrophosphate-requiring protein [Devosia nitrariae]|uniref:Acetolactate synthase n=1 Tax=Devosia nitrariae TaxID=2071872 RepID=A0ABQ5W6M5_9HYPH|nr:thiamine pyrophosphate-requiring protein [Devosia nitrariae]GLQ55596.1 acetolactate synthase [Devosia nitrariae]
MTQKTLTNVTVAEAYLHLLADRGIEYFFANAGTDFAPLIEAFAKGEAQGQTLPKPVTAPHENIAVSMALGHALVTGKPQAVMVHVNVGTANALCGLLNAQRVRAPMLFNAGRTPIMEEGMRGARSGFVHWTQEMYDQAGMVREAVKWDYELRNGEQLELVVDRALSIAGSAPQGPVYLTLPREVLATTLESFTYTPGGGRQRAVTAAGANLTALAEAADILARANTPLIITSTLGRNPAAMAALSRFALDMAIPVVSYNPRTVDLPSTHPMNMGQDINAWLGQADAILVLDTMVPWLPREGSPRAGAKVIHIGEDPLYQNLPIRSFQCDLAISADTEIVLGELGRLMADGRSDADKVEHRRAGLAERRRDLEAVRLAAWRAAQSSGDLTPLHISRAIDAIKGDALVFKESGLRIDHMTFDEPGTYFFSGAAGGLGWSLGAALGAQVAAPDRLVISTVGDGSYMFGTPLAAHFVAAEQQLPVLFVVFNNRGWHAVRRSTRGMYKEGYAADASKQANEPLTDFGVEMNFEKVMDVVGGHGERVEHPDDLPKALDRALTVIRSERRQVLLNVMCTT